MLDAKALLDQFLGTGDAAKKSPLSAGGLADAARGALGGVGPLGGFAGGAAAGGLLAMLLGGKGRKTAGRVLTHGGAAVLGALAFRAWQNWQAGKAAATGPVANAQEATAMEARFLPGATPAAGGEPFELSLVRAMVGAARADGHIDAAEQSRIFEQVERAGLDAEAKAVVFDLLNAPVGVSEVAASAATPEQGAELWLASRLAVDPDNASERAYLDALAHRLKLAPDLVQHLERQAASATA